MRLIDANELLETITKTVAENLTAAENVGRIIIAVTNATTVDAVEVDAIQAWLYAIAMNNTGNVSRVCEELISRLDGLRVFAKERRTNES